MEIKNVREDLKAIILYILRHIEHLNINNLIEKTEWLAKSFNQHHFAFVVCKELKGYNHRQLPAATERYLRKLIFFLINALEMLEEGVNHIDKKRQKDY